MSGLVFYAATKLPAPHGDLLSQYLSPENGLMQSLQEAWDAFGCRPSVSRPLVLLGWAVVAQVTSTWSFRRLQDAS